MRAILDWGDRHHDDLLQAFQFERWREIADDDAGAASSCAIDRLNDARPHQKRRRVIESPASGAISSPAAPRRSSFYTNENRKWENRK